MINRILKYAKFPQVESLELEHKKLGLLRFILGFVVCIRFFQVVLSFFQLNGTISPIHVISLIVVVAFTLGFFTPISALSLVILVRRFDSASLSDTLGSSILILFIVLIFLSLSGQYYSLDNFILKRRTLFSKWVRNVYFFLGGINKNQLTTIYFFIFCLYAYISFAALSAHIEDPYWINGLTSRAMLTSSYLSPAYHFFRSIEEHYLWIIQDASILASIFQGVFQFLMLPLVFCRVGLFFVKWWGINFFLISLFFLSLSYLPHVELVLWVAILFPMRMDRARKISIFYDDYCSLCKRAMKFFKWINFNECIVFIPVSASQDIYEKYNLNEKLVKTYMVGICNGNVFIGYDLYYTISKANPLLWPIFPLLLIGKIGGLGRRIYSWIAENRYKIFGICELSYRDEIAERFQAIEGGGNRLYKPIVLCYALVIIVHALYNLPFNSPNQPLPHRSIVNRFIYQSGIELPNVFNKTDLSMGDNWLHLRRFNNLNPAGNIVPFCGIDGQRLNYLGCDPLLFKNHNSDLLYFGTTLDFRRTILFTDDVNEFMKSSRVQENVQRRIQYDYNKTRQEGKIKYMLQVFQTHSSIIEHGKADIERHNRSLIYESYTWYDGNFFFE